MRISSRNLLPLGLLVLALASPLWLTAAKRFFDPRVGETAPAGEGRRSFRLDDLVIYQHDGDTLSLRADLSSAFSADGSQTILFRDLKADLIDGKGGRTALTGASGSYDQQAKVLSLDGDVRVETGTLTGTTVQLSYYPDQRLLRTAAEVHLAGRGISATGAGFAHDMKNGEMRLGGGGRVICDIH